MSKVYDQSTMVYLGIHYPIPLKTQQTHQLADALNSTRKLSNENTVDLRLALANQDQLLEQIRVNNETLKWMFIHLRDNKYRSQIQNKVSMV